MLAPSVMEFSPLGVLSSLDLSLLSFWTQVKTELHTVSGLLTSFCELFYTAIVTLPCPELQAPKLFSSELCELISLLYIICGSSHDVLAFLILILLDPLYIVQLFIVIF